VLQAGGSFTRHRLWGKFWICWRYPFFAFNELIQILFRRGGVAALVYKFIFVVEGSESDAAGTAKVEEENA
jgi:hypothetical protein